MPNCKIIFVSQHDSSQMVKEAMNVGGHGYVTKIDAAEELLKLSDPWVIERPL